MPAALVRCAGMTQPLAALAASGAGEDPPPPPVAPHGIAAAADRAVWDERIRAHDHRVVVSLLAMGLRIDRARELAQATWTRLIENERDGKLADIRLPGLAIRQARFLALEELRAARRDRRFEPLELHEHAADPGEHPERAAITRDELRRVGEALRGCAPMSQRVFHLVYSEPALSHADVARQVGLSLQRVRQILCEVRARLRVALREEETP
jgi:RNA polymerase sigma-70 factor (ECF subfamily)